MGDWKGPFGRDHLSSLVYVWVMNLVMWALIAIFKLEREDITTATIFYFVASAIVVWVAMFATRERHRMVWSSDYSRHKKDHQTILNALSEVLDTRPESAGPSSMKVFRVGKAIVAVKKSLLTTIIFVGPMEERAEVERLKGLVDSALG